MESTGSGDGKTTPAHEPGAIITVMADHERLASERVDEGRPLNIDRDRVKLPNDRETTLGMMRHPGASGVVPFVTPDEILLIRLFRQAAGVVVGTRRDDRPRKPP